MQSAEPQAVERQCELQPQLTPAGVKHAYVDLYNIRANSCGSRYTLIQPWDMGLGLRVTDSQVSRWVTVCQYFWVRVGSRIW